MVRRKVKVKARGKKIRNYNLNNCNSSGGAVYFLGFIGSAVYYISTATGFWMGVLGVLKSLVWPAFLIFELFKFLGM